MAALTAPGVGSGLDVKSLVSKLMEVERKPLELLGKQKTGYDAKLSAYGTLKGALSALQTAAAALSSPAKLTPMKAGVSDQTVMSVAAESGAAPGNYQVQVQQLARAQRLVTATVEDPNDTVVGGGTLNITFGSLGGGGFAANPDVDAVSVTVPAGASLNDVRDAINDSNSPVKATLVNDGTGYRLMLSATDSGAEHAMQISVTDDDGNDGDAAGLSMLAYNPAGASQMTQTAAARDAIIQVDGLTITKSSNTIADGLQGVTLRLQKETPDSSATLNVETDTAAVKTAIEAFVKAYNDFNKTARDLTAYDPATKKGGALNGDNTVRSLQRQLRGMFNVPVAGAAEGQATLADFGITFQADGSLGINSARLETTLNDPLKDISQVFAKSGITTGYASQVDTLVSNLLASDGLLTTRTEGISKSISALGRRSDALEDRLASVEKRYLAQFTALDAAIASMNATSSFLTQQLANLPGSGG